MCSEQAIGAFHPNTGQVGAERMCRRPRLSCPNLVVWWELAAKRGFVALVHRVGLVIPGFVRAVFRSKCQQQE